MATIWEANVDRYKAGLLAQGIEQGIERGIEQGRADGERALCRVAARRFGDDGAERLRPLLRRVPADRLDRVGDWLVDCDTGEEVIRHVEALAANCPPAGAFKRYFSLAAVVEDLLRGFAARDWAESLDFSTLTDASPEFIDETLLARCGAMVWRVCFRHGTLANGTRRYLFVLLKFQSSVDAHMQWRMRRYSDALLERLMHNGVLAREGELPPVLPVVLYNGSEPWTAQGSAPPGWATPGRAEALPDRERHALAPFRGQAYHLVDMGEWRAGGWPPANRVSAWARLQHAGTPEELVEWLSDEMARRPGTDEEPVRRALHAWAGEWWGRLTGEGPEGFPPFEEMERAGGGRRMATIWEANVDRYKAGLLAQGIEQGIERGIERGRADGEQRALCRVAARRFGDGAAERLRPLLRRVPVDGLARVGDWLVDCDTGEEVLRHVEALAANGSPTGR